MLLEDHKAQLPPKTNWNKKLQTKFFIERAGALLLMEAIGRQSPFFPALKKMEKTVLEQQ